MENLTEIANDKLNALFVYDNGALRNRVARRRAREGELVGTLDADGYLVARVEGRVYKVHRLVYAMFHGICPALLDHINGNKTDNRIENLRPATATQNGYNRKKNHNSTSFKGVSYMHGKWVAQCQVAGKRHYLGLFCSPEAANAALIEFRRNAHGEYANHG